MRSKEVEESVMMKHTKIFYLCLCAAMPAYGAMSVVYNLRIAETSKRFTTSENILQPSTASITAFGTWRQTYTGIKQSAEGGLFSVSYSPKSYFLRADAAFGHVASRYAGVCRQRTQLDDILLSGGWGPDLADNVRLSFSGLVGIPTHNDTSLELVQFGYGHWGAGAQVDASWAFTESKNYMVRGAARIVHLFPRTTPIIIAEQEQWYRFGVGNVADLYCCINGKRGLQGMEFGYDASILFGTYLCPSLPAAIADALNLGNDKIGLRNSFYGAYKHGFLLGKHLSMVAAAVSYGFDSLPRNIGNKYVITAWIAWGINF